MDIRSKVTGRTTEYVCSVVEACAHVFAQGLRSYPESYDDSSRRASAKKDVEKFLELL